MVGVVVDHDAATPEAAAVEAASGGLELRHRLLQCCEGNTLQPAGGHGGGGVAEIVAARQGKFKTAHQLAVLEEIGPGAIAQFFAGDGGEGHPIGPLGRPPAVRREGLPQDRAVFVG